MANKLAAMISSLSIVMLFSVWLLRRVTSLPVVSVDKLMFYSVMVTVAYFIVGLYVSKLGISLVQEIIADRRVKEDDRRNRARERYEQMVAEADHYDVPVGDFGGGSKASKDNG